MLRCGVIEGFYGRSWSWHERRRMIDFLAHNAMQQYCYAPKSDELLRKNWQQAWPADDFAELQQLSEYARSRGVAFGLGLSPLSLLQQWPAGQAALECKLQEIKALSPDFLAVLFDDTRGDMPQLADRQCRIMHTIAGQLPQTRLLMCPTYYSFDPLLPELFGAMPTDYWQTLGEQLDPAIDLLWTGNQVISEDYPAADLQHISNLFRRQPVIWDNSRVNDGRKSSPFLPLRAMTDVAQLQGRASALLVNPMNPPTLAMIVLQTLTLQGDPCSRLEQAINRVAPELQQALGDTLGLLRDKGLDNLADSDRQLIERRFAGFEHPAAREIMQWLAGAYRFDPDCLT